MRGREGVERDAFREQASFEHLIKIVIKKEGAYLS
jgi:hypothetical protein